MNTATMIPKIQSMLDMQDAMNTRVNADWRQAAFPWYRAIWTECAEMLEHYGWKWWKHHRPDMQQVKLELVDIWHFTLSARLMREESPAETAARIALELQHPSEIDDIRMAIETLAKEVIETRDANIPIFARIMQLAELDFDQLYRTYVGKNVLNFFRQDHGYQEGVYQKRWQGREDNEWLAEILNGLNADSPEFAEAIYRALSALYPGPQAEENNP